MTVVGIIIVIVMFIIAVSFATFLGASMASASYADNIAEIAKHYEQREQELMQERNFYLDICREHDLLDVDWEASATVNMGELSQACEQFFGPKDD